MNPSGAHPCQHGSDAVPRMCTTWPAGVSACFAGMVGWSLHPSRFHQGAHGRGSHLRVSSGLLLMKQLYFNRRLEVTNEDTETSWPDPKPICS